MSICKRPLIPLSLLLIITFSPLASRSMPGGQVSYESLLERVKKVDPAADFTALRMAFADSTHKDGIISPQDMRQPMFSAMREKKYEKAIEYAEKIISSKFVDINAHLVAAAAYKEKGHAEKEQFHHYVADGLIKSILSSGDGKSQKTAYTVISTDEEYVILRVYGVTPGTQALLNADGHFYDRLDAVNPKTKEKVTLYFNIDRHFASLQKLLKK